MALLEAWGGPSAAADGVPDQVEELGSVAEPMPMPMPLLKTWSWSWCCFAGEGQSGNSMTWSGFCSVAAVGAAALSAVAAASWLEDDCAGVGVRLHAAEADVLAGSYIRQAGLLRRYMPRMCAAGLYRSCC